MVVLVRRWSSTEAATSELSASRETPTSESAAVACDGEGTAVTSFHGGPSRTVSQRDHQEGGAKQG
jgi:hypothetical protein